MLCWNCAGPTEEKIGTNSDSQDIQDLFLHNNWLHFSQKVTIQNPLLVAIDSIEKIPYLFTVLEPDSLRKRLLDYFWSLMKFKL